MTPEQAKRIVIVGMAGTGLVSFVGYVGTKKSLPSSRILAGTFISAVLLSVLAEPAPKVAGGIAATSLVASLFVFGGPAWLTLANVSAGRTAPNPLAGAAAGAIQGAIGAPVTATPAYPAGGGPVPNYN